VSYKFIYLLCLDKNTLMLGLITQQQLVLYWLSLAEDIQGSLPELILVNQRFYIDVHLVVTYSAWISRPMLTRRKCRYQHLQLEIYHVCFAASVF
jgi:hypothetical protein